MAKASAANINFSRLRRGMVFWYDPDPDTDKSNVPPKEVDGHIIKDYIMYGERPFVVVSSDEACRLSPVVQVCPIGSKVKENSQYDVIYNSFNDSGQSVIKCDQIKTINSSELYKYECMLDDIVMDEVTLKLRMLLGITDTETEVELPVVAMSAEEVEELIDSKLAANQVDFSNQLDSVVTRIINAVSTMLRSRPVTKPLDSVAQNNLSDRVKKQIILVSHNKEKK